MVFDPLENINTPNILVADSRFRLNLRIGILIFVILGVVIELGWIFLQLESKKEAPIVLTASLVEKEPVRMILSQAKSEYQLGETVSVEISLSVGNSSVAGVDAYLSFDPNFLEASSSAIEKTDLFGDYPQSVVLAQEGKIMISAIRDKFSFSGQGSLANVKFKAKQSGNTQIKLDFTPGSTTDSNVVSLDNSEDLLEEVQDLNLVIR